MRNHTRPFFVPEMSQRVSGGKRRITTEKLAVETVRGATGAPWKALENGGKRTTRARNVGILSPRKRWSEKVSRGRRRKASRNTRPVAVGIASQRILGASTTP